MSRTTLCLLTAGGLAAAALALMVTRHQVLGRAVAVPGGADAWKVTLLVQGKHGGDARLLTALPLDFGRQHVLRVSCRSDELLDKPLDTRHPERPHVVWAPRAGTGSGPFRARCEFFCTVGVARPSAPMADLTHRLHAPPRPGELLQSEPGVESDHPDIAALARTLTALRDPPTDVAEALYQYVAEEVADEPHVAGPAAGAAECLHHQAGDAAARARLLVALLRNRGVPARLVTGLALAHGKEQKAHTWVEAWLREQWLPMCPAYRHFGRVPRTYLVFGYGDAPLVRGRNVRGLDHAFQVERFDVGPAAMRNPSLAYRVLSRLSLTALPPAEQRLVEFLLLLPIAALIICIYRNVVGLQSFGTFAPALLGLAFRELYSLPGMLVFVSILLVGWLLRRGLDRYNLLQVPRQAFLLSLVVIVLVGAIVAANEHHLPATRYISLFPLVILTGMIERFWTLEEEDGTAASFQTLLCTMLIAATISAVLSLPAVVRQMFDYPETLGLVMAVQLLLGRYTGYRLLELYRFREFLREPEPEGPAVHVFDGGRWAVDDRRARICDGESNP